MEILPFVSFFTGVISILSPCILPVIPVFVAFSLKSKTKGELLAFVLGFLSIFAVIIVLTGFFTSIVYGYIVYVRMLAAVLLLAIGILMLFDYSFNFAIPFADGGDGILSYFTFGFLTSVSWAPCYSGYLISLIGLLVSSNNALYAVFNLCLYCIGFALTLMVLGFLVSKIDLKKLISKTKYIPKIFALLIIVSAVYLFWESLKVLI